MRRFFRTGSILGSLVLFALAVVFVGPMIGIAGVYPLEEWWAQALLIGAVVLVVALVYGIGWWRRRRAEKALEEDVIAPGVTGDADVLGEKMTEALGVLRKSSGSRAYLYDLPWYVIIGPPGAGKTTALLNSGIRFPLAEKTGGALPGAGGTRYCDWWFSDEAVLIDTAGRYTTQDSDAEADRESWLSFLGLLKQHRARQPINGVLVALGLDEVLTATPEELERQAVAIRDRLVEIQEVLKVDVPVYVLFTKADLIAGFTEYFGAFSAARRQKVWGATFQPKTRRAATVQDFPGEFDALVARLSEEVTDRLQEEPDGVARIAIFGFPAQVAMLKPRLNTLLNEVFASTRYRVSATLRGFYLTSGTQEGTPIDQVLGAMERSFGAIGAGVGHSGRGKSYFLHDLLRKVVFAEAGWVSFDRAAVRREAALRYGSFAVLGVVTAGLLAVWGTSFHHNRGLVRTAEAALAEYERAASTELSEGEVNDPDLIPILGQLQMLRDMPMGYGAPEAGRSGLERFGFSQRPALQTAARASYRDALERSFRSRLILELEQRIIEDIETADTISLYESLKAYKLIGHAAMGYRDDEFLRDWFRAHWAARQYPGPAFRDTRARLEEHLDDLLTLTATQSVSRFALNGALIDQAEFALARIPVEDQAYLLITSGTPDIADFSFAERGGGEAELVFETLDGSELGELTVPAIFTYAGFHQFFLPRLAAVAEKLETEAWVLGERADQVDVQGQLGTLGPVMLSRYGRDFVAAWEQALANLRLRPMSADPPAFTALGAASAAGRLSPLFALAESISQETRLTADFGAEGSFGAGMAEEGSGSGIAGVVADQVTRRVAARTSGMTRIGIDIALAAKSDGRASGRGGGGSAPLPGANIEAQFSRWHNLFEGDPGGRPIDGLQSNLRRIHQLLSTSAIVPGQGVEELTGQIGALKANASRLPEPLTRMMLQAAAEFEGDAANTAASQLNERLNTEVTQVCERIISNGYPFAANSSRDVPMAEFARLFAPGGVMDSFFSQHLEPHSDTSADPWTWRENSPLGDRLSPATLRQFQHAADIRDAFFPGGASMPGFDIIVSQTAMHADVQSALFEINGQVITTRQTGNTPHTLGWPASGGGGSASIQLSPEARDAPSAISARQPGPWALMRLINEGRPRPSGTAVDVRYNIGGRYIAYNIRSVSSLNPFFLRSLWDFRCPRGL